jgi:nicotinate-nucleotide adenylyltransferase
VALSSTHVTGAVGLYGGTFDPIHLAHLRLAEELADALELAQVRFVPSGVPPHRAAPVASATHRLAMTRRAVAGNPRFSVDTREVERAGPSYMVDTLASLRSELGDEQPLWLLLGADAFLGLPGWHDWMQLFTLAHIAVAERPGVSILQSDSLPDSLRAEIAARQVADGSAAGPAGTVLLRHMTPLDISATAIREALARGYSARYLLPDSVLDYIKENRLYA